jgi:hypothetical protein
MAITIVSPPKSFIQFNQAAVAAHCLWPDIVPFCLQAYENADYNFQFALQAETEEEADSICTVDGSGVTIGLLSIDETVDVTFTSLPQRVRISPLQVGFNWSHGLEGMIENFQIGDCFNIYVAYGETVWKSNCFTRIGDDCFTSVLEYGNEENFAGFSYCGGGSIGDEDESTVCEPTISQFINQDTLTIPYTAMLQDKYGVMPTVQVWLYDGSGNLVNAGIEVKFDAFPPTQLLFDFGGTASGVIVIR